jgi:hypothetical protein
VANLSASAMALHSNLGNQKPDEFFRTSWDHLATGLNKLLNAIEKKTPILPKEWWTYHEYALISEENC